MKLLKIISTWFQKTQTPRNIMAYWRERNSVHSRVFLLTLEVDYLVFEQDVFMLNTGGLADRLIRLGFTTDFSVSNDKLGPLCRTYWNKEHNIVIRLVTEQNWQTLKLALEVIALLKKADKTAAITMTDIVVSTMMTLNSNANDRIIRLASTAQTDKLVSQK